MLLCSVCASDIGLMIHVNADGNLRCGAAKDVTFLPYSRRAGQHVAPDMARSPTTCRG